MTWGLSQHVPVNLLVTDQGTEQSLLWTKIREKSWNGDVGSHIYKTGKGEELSSVWGKPPALACSSHLSASPPSLVWTSKSFLYQLWGRVSFLCSLVRCQPKKQMNLTPGPRVGCDAIMKWTYFLSFLLSFLLLLFLCAHLCVCVSPGMCVYMCTCVPICIWRSVNKLRCHTQVPPILFFFLMCSWIEFASILLRERNRERHTERTSNHDSAWNCHLKSVKQASFITLCLCGLPFFILYFAVGYCLPQALHYVQAWCGSLWWTCDFFPVFLPHRPPGTDWHLLQLQLSCDWGWKEFPGIICHINSSFGNTGLIQKRMWISSLLP